MITPTPPETNVVAIMRSNEAASALQQAATGIKDTRLQVELGEIATLESNPTAMNGHDILLVDLEPGNAAELEHLKQFIRTHHQARPIIVTAADFSPEEAAKFLQLGAVDVLAQPIRKLDLAVALDHALRQDHQGSSPKPRGKIVSFLKAGGGVGTTTLAVQSAGILATGKKKVKRDVCVLDLDLQFGAVGHYLDLGGSNTLTDLLEVPERMDAELLESVMVQHSSGIKVLQSPVQVLPLEVITPEFVTRVLDLTTSVHDYILVDLPDSWTGWSYEVLRQSDLIVLVCQENVGSIRQAARQIETIREQDLTEIPLWTVLNRYSGGTFWGRSQEVRDAEKALKRRFNFLVPNDFGLVSEAVNRGVLVSRVKRRSRLEKTLRKMSDAVLDRLTEAPQLNAEAVR